MIVNEKKRGCFGNYDFAINYMLENTQTPLIAVMQDDFIYSGHFMKELKKIVLDKNFGYFNFLSVAEWPELKNILKLPSWNRSDIGMWAWGQAYVMKRETVKRIIETKYYQEHKAGRINKEKTNQMIDGCISECCKLLGLPMYYHNPSLIQHIGHVSSVGHKGILTGYKFKE
jgi:hypothetical protein